MKKIISQAPYTDIDYVKICDTETIKDVDKVGKGDFIALAVKVAKTRLIDNHVFGEKI